MQPQQRADRKIKKKKKKKGKKSGSFQVVSEGAQPKARPRAEDEDEDDADSIRAANAVAVQKRQKQAKNAEKKVPKQVLPARKDKKRDHDPARSSTSQGKEKKKDEDGNSDAGGDGLSFAPGVHGEEDEGNTDNDGSNFDELQVDFDFVNPKEEDFHGIKLFVKDLLDGEEWDASAVADLILEQSGAVGSVIKVVDQPDDLYGVVSALSFKRCTKSEGMRQLRRYILAKCPAGQRDHVEAALGGATALIVNERMFNVPQELAVPLMQGLFDEIRWSQDEKAGKDVPGGYNFTTFVFLSRFLKEAGSGEGGSETKTQKKKNKKSAKTSAGDDEADDNGRGGGGGGEDAYVKAEDEIVRQHAEMSFEFPLSSREAEGSQRWCGLVSVLAGSRVPVVLAGLTAAVGDLAMRNQKPLD